MPLLDAALAFTVFMTILSAIVKAIALILPWSPNSTLAYAVIGIALAAACNIDVLNVANHLVGLAVKSPAITNPNLPIGYGFPPWNGSIGTGMAMVSYGAGLIWTGLLASLGVSFWGWFLAKFSSQ